jgi:hypothetical protein
MNIIDLLPTLSYACLYFYKQYYKRIYQEDITIPDVIFNEVKSSIYNKYMNVRESIKKWYEDNELLDTGPEEVCDIQVCPYPFGVIYLLEDHVPSFDDVEKVIDAYFQVHENYFITTQPINILSIGYNPLENSVNFDLRWVKDIINLYKY